MLTVKLMLVWLYGWLLPLVVTDTVGCDALLNAAFKNGATGSPGFTTVPFAMPVLFVGRLTIKPSLKTADADVKAEARAALSVGLPPNKAKVLAGTFWVKTQALWSLSQI